MYAEEEQGMRQSSIRVALCLALAIAGMTAAHAADTPGADAVPEPRQTENASLQDFIKANPDCVEFTDQCSHCVVANGVAECSTAEIACIKRENYCTRRIAD
ncbi:hypothetical protein N183_34455 [Sinorhizobium sp. Sb3]|nr:hypothetical protein N183_34455 [Sinorhizobium sp. Sb3]